MTISAPPPSRQGVINAATRIDPVFLDSALLNHPAADDALGLHLHVKVESLNPIRSFKGRGAEWFLENLAPGDRPLVAASAGNFGQALAYAATKRNRHLTVFAATTANPLKIAAMRRLGADVILEGGDFDAAKAASKRYAEVQNGVLVEDGEEQWIAEGAGTIALELTRDLKRRGQRIDQLLVPLGNGALLTGVGTWMKSETPDCQVIGIVAETAPAMMLSWRAGQTITTETAPTIADGIAVREPTPYALACMPATVDHVWSVGEAAIIKAMQFCHRHFGLVIEPAGAAGLAAIMDHRADLAGQSVATILCGGNMTQAQMSDYLTDRED